MPYDYTTLVADKSTPGSIKNWVARSDIPSDLILEEAQSWIYAIIRPREMRKNAPITITKDAESIDAPADFMSSLSIMLNQDSEPLWKYDVTGLQELQIRDENGALPDGKPYRYAGIPKDVATGGGTYYFETKSDEDYAGFQWYIFRPANLSSGNPTNFLTARYPTLLRLTCLFLGYQHAKDWVAADRIEPRAIGQANQVNVEADTDLAGVIQDRMVI